MRNLVQIVAVALLALAGGVAYLKAAKPGQPVPGTSAPVPSQLIPPAGVPAIPPPQPSPQEKSIDQILDELERVRVQKAELEKREQELIKEARRKLDKQTDRATRLGVVPVPHVPPQVDTNYPTPTAPPSAIPRPY